MQVFSYSHACNPTQLADELIAAGVAVLDVLAVPPAADALVYVADSQARGPVDTVVQAHVPAAPPTDAAQAQDASAYSDLRTQYQAMLTRLDGIQGQMDTISNTPGTGTLASLTTAVKTEAAAMHDMAVGMERVLRALAAAVRRQT